MSRSKSGRGPAHSQITRAVTFLEKVDDSVDFNGIEDDGKKLMEVVKALERQSDGLGKHRENLQGLIDQAQEALDELDEKESTLEERQTSLDERQEAVEEREAAIVTQEADLLQREEEIASREIAAEQGFLEHRRESLRVLEEDKKRILAEIAELTAERDQAAAEAASEARRRTEQARAEERTELAEAWQELEEERKILDSRRAALHRERSEVQAEATRVQASAELANRRLEAELEARAADLTRQMELVEGQVERVTAERDEALEHLRTLEQERSRQAEDPAEVARQLEAAVRERDRLRDEIAALPTRHEAVDLRTRAEAYDDAVSDYETARLDQAQLQRELMEIRLDLARSEATELDLAAKKDRIAAYEQTIEDLRASLRELTERAAEEQPFPECSRMDVRGEPDPVDTEAVDLKTMVDRARHHMAANDLYYSEQDLRLFVAGMSASRLHILEGISGTGKTSLPRAFARAISGLFELVEVQAGWRDRDDLLGYYNTFEARYRETAFTRALYRASLPANADRPAIVVLDEANLSHVEQYFAVLLSKLENPGPIELVDQSLPHAPDQLVDGRSLPWPDNTWFMLTANNDETTYRFADKTYDRAAVLELPRKHPDPSSFPQNAPISLPAVSYSKWMQAANDAIERRRDTERGRAVAIHEALAESLYEHAGVGWGNRIEEQMIRTMAVGEEIGLAPATAADHVLTTKVLRKVVGRFDIQRPALEAISDAVLAAWEEQFSKPPELAFEVLTRDMRRVSA